MTKIEYMKLLDLTLQLANQINNDIKELCKEL